MYRTGEGVEDEVEDENATAERIPKGECTPLSQALFDQLKARCFECQSTISFILNKGTVKIKCSHIIILVLLFMLLPNRLS